MPDNGVMAATDPAPGRRTARELNELIRYTMWSVFRVRDGAAPAAAAPASGKNVTRARLQ